MKSKAIKSAHTHAHLTHAKAKADAVEGKAAHTPGPFSISGMGGDNHIMAPWRGGKASVAIAVAHPHMKPGELEANKALLAAAPGLLAALEALLKCCEAQPEWSDLTDRVDGSGQPFPSAPWIAARAAIAKAKGYL